MTLTLVNLGTPTVVPKVKGTLLCNDTEPGFGELVDTEAVRLSKTGDATFSGRVDLPASCTEEPEDMVFLIRIADVSEFEELIGLWNAFGAVRVIHHPRFLTVRPRTTASQSARRPPPRWIADRANDGSSPPQFYLPVTANPGEWLPTPGLLRRRCHAAVGERHAIRDRHVATSSCRPAARTHEPWSTRRRDLHTR